MLKLVALTACVATAFAAKVTNDGGNILLEVEEGQRVGYQSGKGDATYLDDTVTDGAASQAVSFLHLGYTNGYNTEAAKIQASIDEQDEKIKAAQDKHDELAAKLKLDQAAYDEKFGAKIVELQKELAEAATGSLPNEIKGIAQVCSGDGETADCTTIGGQSVMLAVIGEVYANSKGVFDCTYTWQGNVVKTQGMGHIASATGKLSAVSCDTPVFSQEYLAKVGKPGTWNPLLTITQGGETIKWGGATGKNTVKFTANPPAFTNVDAFAKVEIFSLQVSGGKKHLVGPFEVTDLDSSKDALKFAFAGVDTGYLKPSIVFVESPETGKFHFNVQFMGPGKSGNKDMSVTMTVSDQNGAQASTRFKVAYSDIPNLILKLSTTRGGKVRSWVDTGFWEAKEGEVNGNAGKSTGYKSYGNDIKTKGYYAPIGKRLDFEFYQGSSRRAVASYDINSAFQGISLRDLVAESKYDQKVIGKKNGGRSSGRFYGSLINGNDGNCRPRKGDGFVDQNYDLRVRMRNEYNSQDEWDRIGFVYNGCKGGHIFGGIGGTHKHGGWTVAYEVMPIVGYCNTWNGYGSDNHGIHHPRGGAHPYRNCGGWRRRYNIDVAITRGQ